MRAEEPAVHEKRIEPLKAAMRSLKAQQSGRAEARTTVSTYFQASPRLDGTNAIPQCGRPRRLVPPHP